jgi:heptosyltransferase II
MSERILLRVPNWIGDAVLSLGALRDLRRSFPRSRLEVLARGWVAGLYAAVSEVDGVRQSLGLRADAAALRGAYDLGVLLPNSFGSALSLRMAGLPERWGYATAGRRVLLTRGAPVPAEVRGRSQVYYYRAMLAGVGLSVSASPDVSLRCPDAWSERAAELLPAGEGAWVGLNPGAAYGTAKRWIPERFSAVGDMLARRQGARVVILGSAAERPLGEAIAAGMRQPALVLCGQTSLPDLVGVLARLRLLITGDSGPMHLAAALGTRLVALFGPTNWRETSPVGAHARVLREDVECAPCMLRECPIDHRCMRRIGIDRVAAEAEAMLAAGDSNR